MGTNASASTVERARLFLAWAIVALGVIHVLATPYFVPDFSERALWFASGGCVFILVGIFNLFAVFHGHSIPTLRQVTLAANVLTTAFVVALVLAPPTGPGEFVAALLIIPTTVLSFTARRRPPARRVAA